MLAHRAETVVEADGSVHVANLPIEAGAKVEVIVLEGEEPAATPAYPLRDRAYHVKGPDWPTVPEEVWNIYR